MALLIRSVSRRLTRQPQRPLEIDRGTRAGQAISNLIPFGPVNRDVVTGAVLTLAAGVSSIADPGGLALRGSGTSAAASIPLDLSSYNQIALSFWLYWDAYANDDKLAMEHGTNFATSHGFLIDPNSGAPFAGSFQVGSNGLGRSFTRPSAAGWHHYFCHLRSQGGAGTDVVSVYVDGVAQSLSASAGSPSSTNFGNNTLYLFSRAGSSLIGAGRLRNLVVRPAFEATSEDIRREFEKPWSLYRVPAKRRYVQIGGASALSLTPGVGALALIGHGPALTQTTTLALVPGAGALAANGYPPTISQSAGLSLTPTTAAVALIGYVPAVARNTAVEPGVAALSASGYAPTVSQPVALALSPGLASLVATGYAPAVAQASGVALTPSTAPVAVAGYAPVIAQSASQWLVPGAASLAVATHAPVVTGFNVAPSVRGELSSARAARVSAAPTRPATAAHRRIN